MIPENEMGVVVLFAQQIVGLPIELVGIGAEFPDAIIKIGEKEYRVEFEYRSSNFISHKHDPRGCDLIVCWEDTLDVWPLQVWSLSDDTWKQCHIELPTDEEREIAYWKYRALRAESSLKRLQGSMTGGIEEPPTPRLKMRALALKILAGNPTISGGELGRQLGMSESRGRQLRAELLPIIPAVGDAYSIDGPANASDPTISGGELGRKLGKSESRGRQLRAEILPTIEGPANGNGAHQ